MADSHYLHSTLYKFNADARTDVIARFNSAINDVAARCWYDDTQDSFELRCPGVLGPNADEALANAITTYIVEEIQVAERQDRPANVVRFSEGTFDDGVAAFVDSEGSQDESPAEEALGANLTPQPSLGRKEKKIIRIFHIINTESAPSMSLKLFRLHELPEGCLERTLGSITDKATVRAVHTGLTCRPVRFEGKRRIPVFNGRVGQPLSAISADEEAAFLDMVTFPSLQGASTLPEQAPAMRHWKFKEGEEASVSQWLAGMGQTEPDEPELRAEVPRDAKKMLVVDQSPTLGRVRVPKGASFLPADSDDEDEEGSPQANSGVKDFKQLLQRNVGSESDSEESDAESQASRDSGETGVGTKATFSSLLQRPQERTKRPEPHARTAGPLVVNAKPTMSSLLQQPQQAENYRPALHLPAVVGPTNGRAQAAVPPHARQSSSAPSQKSKEGAGSESASDPKDSFPSYGKPFAAVDTIGLTADAASQARWEIEHHEPYLAKTPKGKIQLASTLRQQPLSPLPTSGSAPMSLSTGPELQRLQPVPTPASLASTSHATIRSYADQAYGPEPWANRIVENRAPTGKLLDDTATSATTARPRWPPGLGPPPGVSQPSSRYNLTSRQSAAVPPASVNSGLVDVAEESIIMRQEHGPSKPPPGLSQKLHLTKEYQPPAQRTNDEDQIVERVQPQSNEPVTKRFTMRQKAAPKEGKGNNIPKKVTKAQLPLPDPVPPPRAPKVREPPTADRPIAPEPQKTEPECPPVLQKLEAFLGTIAADSAVAVHFGLILLNTDDRGLRKNAFSGITADFSSAKATFNSRMTSQTKDAHYICSLADGATALRCKVLYEIHTRDASGQSLEIAAEIINDGTAQAVRRNVATEVARCYLHHPTRVWDAIVTAKCDDEPQESGHLDSFLLSLRTIDSSPSFTAIVPPNSTFTVEKVLAKREYSRTMSDGGSLIVTEVQELSLSSLNAPEANLQASSLPRHDMIAESRLWWEARVEVDDMAALPKAIELVTQMDGVGFDNRGPWVRREEEQESVAEVPFW
ncbi:hypothetical protein LTR85_008326 [Meristemomyces frigidus]|nr:hypothetical protein LTR85_008326 [Meristemomyces frigidus]